LADFGKQVLRSRVARPRLGRAVFLHRTNERDAAAQAAGFADAVCVVAEVSLIGEDAA
jgi:hypothetical protein